MYLHKSARVNTERPTNVVVFVGTLSIMPVEPMKTYNVRVRPSTWETARKIADARGERISDVIRDFLKEYVRKNRKVLDEAENQA